MTLDASIRAATERPSVSRTRALLEMSGYTTKEWDRLVYVEFRRAESIHAPCPICLDPMPCGCGAKRKRDDVLTALRPVWMDGGR